ncbi:hypothetical protein H5410_000819 [Solanum commersonii]|uniref:Uncharacterized protein n=1 Tax=Solanum commersonii TaxID=4109 RepID=A0A9J6AX51_SOLCO|nr:hypothetical protein H5410_000819 [Solanum commersonii]
MTKILFFILIKNDLSGSDQYRNGTGMNWDEPVPVNRYQIMIPFCFVYRFNVSHPVPNTTGSERTGTVPVQPLPVPCLTHNIQ